MKRNRRRNQDQNENRMECDHVVWLFGSSFVARLGRRERRMRHNHKIYASQSQSQSQKYMNMIIMQIACDAVTKICYSPATSWCVALLAIQFRADTGSGAGREGAGNAQKSSVSLQRKTGASALTHNRMPKRKIVRKQRTSYEMRCRTESYFICGPWAGCRGRWSDWRSRDFTVNFVISLLMVRSSQTSQQQQQKHNEYGDISLVCLRRPFYTIYWYQILHFPRLLFAMQVSATSCVERKRKSAAKHSFAKGCQSTRWTIPSRNIPRNNNILLKFVIGHDKHRPLCTRLPVSRHPHSHTRGWLVAARIWCVNHITAIALDPRQ